MNQLETKKVEEGVVTSLVKNRLEGSIFSKLCRIRDCAMVKLVIFFILPKEQSHGVKLVVRYVSLNW